MRYYWQVIVACLAQGVWLASASDISRLLRRTANGIPGPISVPPSGRWDGDDGPWSTFTIGVGTPSQTVRVLVSTAGEVTWTVMPLGCTANDLTCTNGRGGIFNHNSSSTWHAESVYYLVDVEQNLDYTAEGPVGNDTLSLGTGGPTLMNQSIGGLVAKDFYLGMLGLNPRPTNYTIGGNGSASLMTSLKDQNLIPSMSLGYTAGNTYRLGGSVFGSLTLGGYDKSRFTPNNLSFGFADNINRDIMVGIQGISSEQSPDLLPDGGILAFVDSTVPHIWLPLTACQAFEKAFGLTYDDTSERYTINATTHSRLHANNASITFNLGRTQSGGDSVNITLPYGSFDLTALWPEANVTGEIYFPLRRAVNASQYTLGRTFLQEAYLTIDWERKNFSISQCVFNDAVSNNVQQLVAILSKDAVPNPTPSITPGAKSSSPGTGEIAGIAVGVIIILALLIGGFAIFKLKQRKKNYAAATLIPGPAPADASMLRQNQNEHTKGELATGSEHERYELGHDSVSKSPSAAWMRSEKPRDFDGGTQVIGVKNDSSGTPELPSPGHGLPLQPVHEMESPSLRPVELDADEPPKQLYGSEADDSFGSEHGPSPPYRSATQSPVPRSMGPSPLSQQSESPLIVHSVVARPGLQSRTSTMMSLPSIRHSLPSSMYPSVFPPPNGAASTSSPPISPMAGAVPDHGLGISSVMGASEWAEAAGEANPAHETIAKGPGPGHETGNELTHPLDGGTI